MKKLMTLFTVLVTLLGSSLSVYAAPKTMPDGNTFDPEFYAATYPDVANVVGTDENALYNHYVTFGQAEGRKPYEGFKTEAEIRADKLAELRKTYPSGSTWDGSYFAFLSGYVKGNGVSPDGMGCQAYAYHITNEIFGDAPAKLYKKDENLTIQMYDIVILNNYVHSAVVIGVDTEANTITVTEGNIHAIVNGVDTGGKVRWDYKYSIDAVDAVIRHEAE